MCGILGICLDNRTRTEDDLVNIKADFANLLLESQVRGTDATGVYIVNVHGGISYLKAPVAAQDMVWSLDDEQGFWKALDANVGPDTVAIIGHTRAATTGSPECNDNNHPIVDGAIVGVHNGVIRNHLALDAKYPKAAEVDSAVIMSMLKTKAGKNPLSVGVIARAYPELVGPAAIAVADTRQPDRVFLARNTNPINFTRDRDAGILMFASTAEILQSALGDNVKTFSMPENTVCEVNHESISGKLVYVPIQGAQASRPVAKKAQKAKPTVADLYPGTFGKDVDAGERCPKCKQCFLVVYIGTNETKCCACNPYGSDSTPTRQGDTKKAKATAKRPTSAKKGNPVDAQGCVPAAGDRISKKNFDELAKAFPVVNVFMGKKGTAKFGQGSFSKTGADSRYMKGSRVVPNTLMNLVDQAKAYDLSTWEGIQNGTSKEVITFQSSGPLCDCDMAPFDDEYTGNLHRHRYLYVSETGTVRGRKCKEPNHGAGDCRGGIHDADRKLMEKRGVVLPTK